MCATNDATRRPDLAFQTRTLPSARPAATSSWSGSATIFSISNPAATRRRTILRSRRSTIWIVESVDSTATAFPSGSISRIGAGVAMRLTWRRVCAFQITTARPPPVTKQRMGWPQSTSTATPTTGPGCLTANGFESESGLVGVKCTVPVTSALHSPSTSGSTVVTLPACRTTRRGAPSRLPCS